MARKSATAERLDELDERLSRVEELLRLHPEARPTRGNLVGTGPLTRTGETSVDPWKHLVRRPHPWRKQLYLRGKNLTARQLVGGMRANQLDEEAAAANYGLPVEAIQESLAYVEENKSLLADEAEIERLMLKREGVSRGPQPLS